jgi:hypothetical protein
MIKDRPQKSKMLRYVVSKGWFPQLEVLVTPQIPTSSKDKHLTDIDLLAFVVDEIKGYRRILIDCKTRQSDSAINRAIWLKGLMLQEDAERGICILKKKFIERDHRIHAANLGVILLTEEEIDTYSNATGVIRDEPIACMADIENWENYYQSFKRNYALAAALDFHKTGFWLCGDSGEAARKVIALGLQLSGELSPDKKEHVAVVGDLLSLFIHATSVVVSRIFTGYLHPERKQDLADALLLLLYGGRDAYEFRNKLQKLVRSKYESDGELPDLTLPEWDRFLNLVRSGLDAPLEFAITPLIIREIAFSQLASENNYNYVERKCNEYRHILKYSIMGAEYFIKATRMPHEFLSFYKERLMSSIKKQKGEENSKDATYSLRRKESDKLFE